MIWMTSFGTYDSQDGYAFYIEPIDGDLRQVDLVDQSIDIGRKLFPSVTYFQSGRALETKNLPTKVKAVFDDGKNVSRANLKLPDYAQVHMGTMVSEAFRNVIEQFDPDTHQFVPVRLQLGADGSDSVQYYWFAPCTRLFSIDPQRTEPAMDRLPEGPDWVRPNPDQPAYYFNVAAKVVDWRPVFKREAVKDHDLFCTGEMTGYTFISDRLKEALEETGMRGLHFMGPYQLC